MVRARGLTAAARHLGMPANTLSRRLRELEAAVGTTLLTRSSRRLHCTAAGEALYEQSRHAVDALERAANGLDVSDRRVRGSVRLAVSSTFLACVRGAFFDKFLALHPEVDLQVTVVDQEPRLVDHGLDLAFRLGTVDKPSKVVRKLGDVGFGLYASAAYLRLHGTPTTLQALAGHRFIGRLGGKGRHPWTLHDAHGHAFSLPATTPFATDSCFAATQAAQAGMGIALLCHAAVDDGHRLLRVMPDYDMRSDGLYAIYPGHGTLSPAARAVLDYVIAATEGLRGSPAGQNPAPG